MLEGDAVGPLPGLEVGDDDEDGDPVGPLLGLEMGDEEGDPVSPLLKLEVGDEEGDPVCPPLVPELGESVGPGLPTPGVSLEDSLGTSLGASFTSAIGPEYGLVGKRKAPAVLGVSLGALLSSTSLIRMGCSDGSVETEGISELQNLGFLAMLP